MDYTHLIFLISGLLFPATLITMEVGRRLGLRRFAQDLESAWGESQTPEIN
jgi:hypothetical protein